MLARYSLIPLVFLALSYRSLAGQTAAVGDSADTRLRNALALRSLRAEPVDQPLVLDGRLDDPSWARAPVATDFVEQGPRPGILPHFRTEARVLYDDEALYVGVRAYDDHPDSIVAPYLRRDDESRSDWIFVEIDSRHDRRTGFGFGVNPRGVQVDATFDQFINYDNAWDGVWEAVPRIDSLGWCVEYRIPFSQLAWAAVPGAPLAFGLNVYRKTARTGESSDWSPRLPVWADLVSHFNDVTDIASPRRAERIELVPYSAAKTSFAPAAAEDPLSKATTSSAYAGIDVRARLAPGFTATAAIRPDFGQVEADPSQVNLTTFETFFPEQRPFFVQGESQFAFDLSLPFTSRDNSFESDQPFYSRRIGRPPHGTPPAEASFAEVPSSTTLLGAMKLSGRTASGWSLGAMSAVTDRADARYVDGGGVPLTSPVEPVSGYGVIRVARQSSDGGSSIGGMMTAVRRWDMPVSLDGQMTRGAFVAGGDIRRRFGDGNWEVSGFALGSRVEGSSEAITRILHGPGHFYQRPDASHLRDDTTRSSAAGIAAQARLARIGGAVRFGVAGHLISPAFEINDLGFQRNADWLVATGWLSWERYPRGGWLRHWIAGSNRIGAGWSLGGERRAEVVNAYVNLDLRRYWGGTLDVTREFPALATELLRGGPALLLPSRTRFAESLYSDTRRPVQLTLAADQSREGGSGSHSLSFSPAVAWRATDRFAISVGPEYANSVNGWQYVTQASGHYVMARLEATTLSLVARADFAFSRKMTLQLYAEPFLSVGRYREFKEVRTPRAPRPADRVVAFGPDRIALDGASRRYVVDTDGDRTADVSFDDPDFNLGEFNLNLVWRWEYRPGSTLFLVWTQSREVPGTEGSLDVGRDLGALFNGPGSNVLLAKVSWRLGVGR
jgi:hypothetical protein